MNWKISTVVLSGVLLILGNAAAQAHSLWFAQRGGQLALIYGLGDDLDMVKRIPNLEAVKAYDPSFEPIGASVRVAAPVVVIDAETTPAVVTAILQSGTFWRKAAGDWQRGGRDVMPAAQTAERTIKYAVTPCEGTHGWYWRNAGDAPVVLTLKTAGFYQDLFEPPME